MGDVYPLLFLWSSNLLISLIMAIWETERERGRERRRHTLDATYTFAINFITFNDTNDTADIYTTTLVLYFFILLTHLRSFRYPHIHFYTHSRRYPASLHIGTHNGGSKAAATSTTTHSFC
jgi:hypothetical protein